ncbi:UNVERIFIED_ORG: hypothetical protein Xoosp15_49 [Xanthomonas phage Xoo-sp15]
MNVLSLFDGMSCGQLALNRAGVKVDNYYASEIEENAIKVTLHNFPLTVQLGDVTSWGSWKLPKIDLLIGGSPCQDLSKAKTGGKGLEGEKSKLFFIYLSVLKELKPKYFFFENVGSMKNSDKAVITEYLGVEPLLINSNLVSAQNRQRYYWTNIDVQSFPDDLGITVADILEDEVDKSYFIQEGYDYIPSSNLKAKSGLIFKCGIISSKKWLDNGKNLSRNFPQGNRVYSVKGKSVSLTANGGGLGGKTGLYYLEDEQPFSAKNIRRLTPTECERLQNVPDGYTSTVPKTHRYKMLGNGWTVDVIAHVLKYIRNEEN